MVNRIRPLERDWAIARASEMAGLRRAGGGHAVAQMILGEPGRQIRVFFRCGCGREAHVDPSIDPRKLKCTSCGARNPKLVTELA